MDDASGRTVWDYSSFDDQGILSKTTTINNVDYTTAQTLTPAGRITQLAYPSGRLVDYQRTECTCDISGVTTTHNDTTTTLVADVSIRPFGLPQAMDMGGTGSLNVNNRYDRAGRLTASNPGTPNARTLSHDVNGNITAIAQTAAPLMNQNFTYDHLGRIDTYIGPFGFTDFDYDLAGNRIRREENGLVDTMAYQTGTNRLESIDSATSGFIGYDYDGAGNTITAGGRTYTYDQENRLSQVDEGGGFVASYVYNGLGQRVLKSTADGATCFLYDFDQKMIAETPAGGEFDQGREYIYNGRVLLSQVEVEAQQLYTYSTNYLGAVHQLVDGAGTVVWEGLYKPFGGAVVNPGSTVVNNWRLPGQYFDQ
jgi:YD repeat-containing protein